ncbi:hypothetical protein AYI69_g8578 [Smittium culicis]|uniref:Uncharacterized protein n=1 Tax=Smittium culicis TaxID=133412 RepID=A0A1R1XIS6_9FUNG|nr:hypothetical protein AYI69_g8578 [Smittium culicis]
MKVHYMADFKRPQPDMEFNYERIQYLVQNEGSSVYVRLWEYDEKSKLHPETKKEKIGLSQYQTTFNREPAQANPPQIQVFSRHRRWVPSKPR